MKLPQKILCNFLVGCMGLMQSCSTYEPLPPPRYYAPEYYHSSAKAEEDNSALGALAFLGLAALLLSSDSDNSATTSQPAKYDWSKPTYTIGRLDDTSSYKNRNFERLDIPNWTPARNDKFVEQIIDEKAVVHIASPITEDTLMTSDGEPTVFSKELKQFQDAGYSKEGSTLIPPKY